MVIRWKTTFDSVLNLKKNWLINRLVELGEIKCDVNDLVVKSGSIFDDIWVKNPDRTVKCLIFVLNISIIAFEIPHVCLVKNTFLFFQFQ